MIVKMKPLFICENCKSEIDEVKYEKVNTLMSKHETSWCKNTIIFSPEKCPHCGEFIECIEYIIDDFKLVK